MRDSFRFFYTVWATLISALVTAAPVLAQHPNFPPQQDPYIGLMMSQPKLDTGAPPNPTANFDPPAVHPGEQATYRVTFNSLEQMVQWPKQLPVPQELTAAPAAHGQTYQMSGPGTMIPVSAFNTKVKADKAGAFIIPEFEVSIGDKKFKVPAATLIVTPETIMSAPGNRLAFELNRKEAFVGEPVGARVFLFGTPGVFQALQQPQITGGGIVVDQGAVRQQIMPMPVHGTNIAVYVYDTLLTPIEAGTLTLAAQGFISGNRMPGNVVITMPGMPAMGPPSLLESESTTLFVKPLPQEGQLPGFTGAIGKLTIDQPVLTTASLRAGEPVRLAVTVHGSTNLVRLIAPPPPKVADWQIFSAGSNSPAPQLAQVTHAFTFEYTLVPLSASLKETPKIPFSYFDPASRQYRDLTIASVPITVEGTADVADAAALVQAPPAAPPQEPDSALGPLAKEPGRTVGSLVPLQLNPWFPAIQLAPATVFFGLWYWDRRRRYLEAHPEVILRRRARRALRRERAGLRKAIRHHDGPAFADAAVRAMRVACARHYPAEPRALVGADVLLVLDENDRAGKQGDAVRHIFAANDAASFADSPKPNGELLRLQPEVETVLESLEAKL